MILDLWFSSFKFSNLFVPAETVILGYFWVLFWPGLPEMLPILFDQWWYARWCIRYATVFIEELRNGLRWAKKLIFCSFWEFLVMPSYTLWVTPQDFAKLKTLLRYIPVVSFISIAFVVVASKIFKAFHINSAYLKWPLLGGFSALTLPNIV